MIKETEHLQSILAMVCICTFSGLSLRNVAKALSFLHIVKRSHVSIWNWIQKYQPKRISSKRNKIAEFIVDETVIKVGSELVWLWVAIDLKTSKFSH